MRDLNPVSIEPNVELLGLGDKLFKQGKYPEARQTYARASQAAGPDHAFVEACAQVARMESLLGSHPDGRPWIELALQRADPEQPLGWSRLQMIMGIYEREAGMREAAVARFTELYEYDLEFQLFERAVDVAHHIVLASDDAGEQMEWTQKGVDAAESGGMQAWLAVLWNNKGASLEEQERWEDAYIAYKKAREYHYQTGNKLRMLIADWALARAERRTGRIEEARDRSQSTYLEARERYDLQPTPTNAEWVGYLCWELAELDALDGETEAAASGLREARAMLIEANIESWGEFGDKELAKLDGRLQELIP